MRNCGSSLLIIYLIWLLITNGKIMPHGGIGFNDARCGNKFGKFFLDKSAHSAKQVEAFRYNDEGIKALRHIIHGQQVA